MPLAAGPEPQGPLPTTVGAAAHLRYQKVWHSDSGHAMVVSVLGGRLFSTSLFSLARGAPRVGSHQWYDTGEHKGAWKQAPLQGRSCSAQAAAACWQARAQSGSARAHAPAQHKGAQQVVRGRELGVIHLQRGRRAQSAQSAKAQLISALAPACECSCAQLSRGAASVAKVSLVARAPHAPPSCRPPCRGPGQRPLRTARRS